MLKDAYQLIAKDKSKDAERLRDIIAREFLDITYVYGGFNNLYPALSRVFGSLPPMKIITEAIGGNISQLENWHEESVKEAELYSESACEMFINDNNIRFITPTSGRIIDVSRSEMSVSCDFSTVYTDSFGDHVKGSVIAATEVLQYCVYLSGGDGVFYYTKTGQQYKASDIILHDQDIIYCERGESAEKNILYQETASDKLSGVLLNHAPEWMKNENLSS